MMILTITHNLDKAHKHVPYLDSLRGIAALLVVMHHACMQFDFSNYHSNLLQRFVLFWFQNGHYSVDFFIVLSGYCLMMPVVRSNYHMSAGALTFFKKRAKRILPTYYCTIMFSLLLVSLLINKPTGSHWDLSIPVSYLDIITHILLIQDIFTTTCYKINHVLWSISVEWRIYFLFPLLLVLWRRKGPILTIAITVLASLSLTCALQYGHKIFPILNNGPNGPVPHYLLLFVIGMLGADISFSPNNSLSNWNTGRWCSILAVATLLLAVAAILSKQRIFIYWQLLDIIVGFWSLCLLVICNRTQETSSHHISYLNAIVNWRPLVFIGTFGYSLYLVHAPILQVVWQYALMPLKLNPFTGFLLLSSVGLLIVLAFSYIFFLLFEKPFIINSRTAPVINLGDNIRVNTK